MWYLFFFFKQKTADEMRISDWSSDVCSSDLLPGQFLTRQHMAFDLRRGDLDHVIDGKRGAQRREDGCCHRARSACHNAGGEHVDITPATMNDREELSFANCIARRQAFDRQCRSA